MASFNNYNNNEYFQDKLQLNNLIRSSTEPSHLNVAAASSATVNFNITSNNVSNSSRKSKKSQEIDRVINEINEGLKVLVILRGLPGSGKSTLARAILRNTIGDRQDYLENHILSADDYFLRNGTYRFDSRFLGEAHGWNHQRCFRMLSKGCSPVIIDNTNTEMWEMKPYAAMAIDYGYILEILEPDTHWCFNENELEKRNRHDVAKGTIRRMLERYDKNIKPNKIFAAYNLHYKLQTPPQYREQPPFSKEFILAPPPSSSANRINYINNSASSCSVDEILMQNDDNSLLNTPILKPNNNNQDQSNVANIFDDVSQAWAIGEKVFQSLISAPRNNLQEMTMINTVDQIEEVVEVSEASTSIDDGDFLEGNLKIVNTQSRNICDIHEIITPSSIKNNKKLMFDKSSLTDEDLLNKSDVDNLMKVFPHISLKSINYWYKSCNMDLQCTIEILLSEKDDIILNVDTEEEEEEEEIIPLKKTEDTSPTTIIDAPSLISNNRRKNNSPPPTEELKKLKEVIEAKVAIGDEHYSERLLRIKKRESPKTTADFSASSLSTSPSASSSEAAATATDEKYHHDSDDPEWEIVNPLLETGSSSSSSSNNNNNNNENNHYETVEMNLGENFVKQLEDQFGEPNLLYPKGFLPVVQIPTFLARQLYTFYIESVYQQMENQQTVMNELVKEDEEFARKLLQEEITDAPSDEVYKLSTPSPPASPSSSELPDIMKEQRKLKKIQQENDKWKELTPDTLAARLTHRKLFEAFPRLERETLIEILHAHNNVYKDTVETLLASTSVENVNKNVKNVLIPPINEKTVKEMWEAHSTSQKIADEHGEDQAEVKACDYREEAQIYLEKRTKLYEKAQCYYQKGMKEVAQFYSELARKQTQFLEYANALAATAFLDESSKRLENFNTLDLHFLYVKEAIPNLDIFIDRNINLLRLSTVKHSDYLEIITGRGKNSARGCAKIRPAVIARLKERKISYNHLNPGLLKIKVTKKSMLTDEI